MFSPSCCSGALTAILFVACLCGGRDGGVGLGCIFSIDGFHVGGVRCGGGGSSRAFCPAGCILGWPTVPPAAIFLRRYSLVAAAGAASAIRSLVVVVFSLFSMFFFCALILSIKTFLKFDADFLES